MADTPENTLISIITPCYKAEAFVECAILSVINQPLKNIELILVNDGSPDNTEEVCLKYQQQDSRIHYYRTENLGAGHARNFGLSKASGEWVMYLDADDLYIDNSLDENFAAALEKYREENVQIIYTSSLICDMDLSTEPRKCEMPEIIDHIPPQAFWNAIYDRSFLTENKIVFFEYREQDIETAFRYRAYTHAQKTAVDKDILFYLQRKNPESNTHTWNTNTLHYIRTLVLKHLVEEFQDTDDWDWLLSELLIEAVCFLRDYTFDNRSRKRKREIIGVLCRYYIPGKKRGMISFAELWYLLLTTWKVDIKTWITKNQKI